MRKFVSGRDFRDQMMLCVRREIAPGQFHGILRYELNLMTGFDLVPLKRYRVKAINEC